MHSRALLCAGVFFAFVATGPASAGEAKLILISEAGVSPAAIWADMEDVVIWLNDASGRAVNIIFESEDGIVPNCLKGSRFVVSEATGILSASLIAPGAIEGACFSKGGEYRYKVTGLEAEGEAVIEVRGGSAEIGGVSGSGGSE